MHNILQDIITKKMDDLLAQKRLGEQDLELIAKSIKKTRSFRNAIVKGKRSPSLIAEIKLASPSAGDLLDQKDVLAKVKAYKKAGVDAISVVTEPHFFKGSVDLVTQIKEVVDIPVLMKDFVIDSYQLIEAKNASADAILLIAKLVTKERLAEFVDRVLAIGLEPVVEVNDQADLEKALATKTAIIAVNARDLTTFEIDIEKACALLQKVPKKYIKLGFSGVGSKSEVEKYRKSGAKGILVGTSLLKATNVQKFIEQLYEKH